jgi:thermitase
MKLKLNKHQWRQRLAALLITPFYFIAQESAFALIGSGSSAKRPIKNEAALALRNWGLDNTLSSHINVRKAWEINKGSREIIVAVIDTGIDPNQPDLKDNLWRKPGTLETKIINGKKTETFEYGWDFVKNEANPLDSHGHGTHVAGIVGASAKGSAGAAGVAPNVSIMAIRYYSQTASGAENLANTIKAIHYAIDNGAHIINYSGGGAEFSSGERKAIERAEKKGILFIAAAGNEHRDTDKESNKYYPGAYGLSNIIAVAATDINNELLSSSNWGGSTVHVTAPGENIYSTLPNGKYGYLTGTSQGTAFVTGLAALMMSEDSSLRNKPEAVKAAILNNVDKIEGLKSKVISGGRINAYATLKALANKVSGIQLADGAKEKILPVSPQVITAPDFSRFEEKRVPARNKNSVE